MSTFSNTASTSSPISIYDNNDMKNNINDNNINNINNNNNNNENRRYSNSNSNKPSLMQSTTPNAGRGSIAKVFNRVAAKVKRSKNKTKNKNKDKDKNKNNKNNKNNNNKCSANCLNQCQGQQQQKVETKETEENNNNNNNNIYINKCSKKRRRFTFDSMERKDNKNLSNLNTENMIKKNGYLIEKKLADTLQGEIYRCKIIEKKENINYFNNDNVVIKVTRKDLHLQGMTILDNGHKKKIQEDIIKECQIIKELTFSNLKNCENNQYMTRYIDFFENSKSYFLVIEDGECDLFEYVVKCHNLLRKGKLERKEWRLMCKKIFKQIIKLLDFLHESHNICHLDISLENMLIKNATILKNINTGKITLNRDITVKFCDFGLSEKFDDINNNFKCKKYVGKTRYKSPELWTKKLIFDARLNDIWSLGIALFMMIMGAPPIKYPDNNDENFKLIINGNILELIQSWNRAKFMTPVILDLLTKMLTVESKRITLSQIKSHPWVKLI